MTRRTTWVLASTGMLVIVIAIGLWLFQPWRLFVDVTVDDAIPTVVATTPALAPTPSATASASEPAIPEPPAGPVELSSGTFIDHEHPTSGTARVVQHPDGSRQLVFEGLATTNGPDVHVWLSAGPVVDGTDGWYTASGYDHVDLGEIKGNLGDQVYDIPADVDLAAYPTVELWCERFSVSFGAAALLSG